MLLQRAAKPTAELLEPVVFLQRAKEPIAVLALPQVLVIRD